MQAAPVAAAHGLLVATENTLSAADNRRLLASVDRPNAWVRRHPEPRCGHDVAAYVEALCRTSRTGASAGRDGRMGNTPLETRRASCDDRRAQARRFDGSLISR
jgi:hypothetical protein